MSKARFPLLAAALACGLWSSPSRAVVLVDSPDVLVRDSTTATTNTVIEALGFETSAFVHPTNSRIVLMGLNVLVGAGAAAGWVSQDGGHHWHGNNQPPHGGKGDPSVVICRSSSGAIRYFVQSLTLPESDPNYPCATPPQSGCTPDNDLLALGQQAVFKDSRTSTTWSGQSIITDNLGKSAHTDKGFLWADNSTGSNAGNLYSVWSDLDSHELHFKRSTDNGVSWGGDQRIDEGGEPPGERGYGEWGVVLTVGISPSDLGAVYAAWPQTHDGLTGPTSSIFFRKSPVNAGVTWSPILADPPTAVYNLGSGKGYGSREELSGKNMGASSAPQLAVDDQANIYIAWGQRSLTGTDADVYLKKSTNGGGDWTALGSAPKRVNQDAGTADQWLPAIAWDNGMKALVVAYFDSRNISTRAEMYLAVSYDRGSTFNELKVSDASWTGDRPPGSAPGSAGDYIAVAAGDGVAYPVWADSRQDSTQMKAYTSPIQLYGIVQSSISTSHSVDAGMVLNLTASWSTNLWSDGEDSVALISPSNVNYKPTATPSSATTSHSVSTTCTCESGYWTYTVMSTRAGYSPPQMANQSKTFRVLTCVD